MITLVVLGLIILALFGSPLFTIIAAGALIGFKYIAGIDIAVIIQEMYRLANAPVLVAIPLFTFAGYLLAESKAPERLVNLTRAIFGWIPGGLAIVALTACAIFTAFTGASGVTIVALGGLLMPALMRARYSERFSLGLVTCSGSLGLLFPPSLPIILFGLIAQVSVNKLFVAGIVPGLVILILLIMYSILRSIGFGMTTEPTSLRKAVKAIKEAAFEIPLPFFVVWGIYTGKFTASEAASIVAVWVFITEVIIYRDIKFRHLPRITRESMILVGAILVILGMALGFTNFLVDQQIPQRLLDFVKKVVESKIMFLVILNLILLVVGCMMDIFSAIVVVVPLILPIAKAFGIDPIHLGMIFLTNLEIGYMTPPVGINLFISSFRFRKPILTLYRASLPFLGVMLIALILITYLPSLSLYLVKISGAR